MSVFRNTTVVGSTTLLSRVTGLARDMVWAGVFPTGTGLIGVFLWAYQIPNTLRRLFAEGAFSQAFVPVVSEYRSQRSRDEVRSLVESTTGTLGLFLLGLSLLGVLAAPVLVMVLGPGFSEDADTFARATEMLRWTFPYVLFISLTALGGAVLNSYQRFAIPAMTSVALNITGIVVAAWIAPHTAVPEVTMAIGVFVAGIVQLLIVMPPVIRMKLFRRPRWGGAHEGVRRIARLMGPAILGSSMGQISVLLSSAIATMFATGSLAWLYFADRLVEFPLGVFSIALATVILPRLSSQHAEQSMEHFSNTLDWALRLLCLIVAPATVALFVLAGPLTVVIFHRGAFTALDVHMTSMALMAYSMALFGWSLIKVLAPGYYARQNTRTPMRIAMVSLGVTMGLNVLLLTVAVVYYSLDIHGLHIGLALTNGVGALLNAWLLLRGLRRDGALRAGGGWRALLLRIALANAVMAAVLYAIAADVQAWMVASTWVRVGWMAGCVTGGMATYFAVLWVLGLRPAQFRMR